MLSAHVGVAMVNVPRWLLNPLAVTISKMLLLQHVYKKVKSFSPCSISWLTNICQKQDGPIHLSLHTTEVNQQFSINAIVIYLIEVIFHVRFLFATSVSAHLHKIVLLLPIPGIRQMLQEWLYEILFVASSCIVINGSLYLHSIFINSVGFQ